MILETQRLILRPWREEDAETLYHYAKDPRVGPIAGWPPHSSVDHSREIINTVFSAPETYAVELKSKGKPVGCIGILFPEQSHVETITDQQVEIGFWIGVPYWGQGLIPEATRKLLQRCFEHFHCSAVWCVYYDGNERSKRAQEKCGFVYHHTNFHQATPMNDIRTEHYTRITRDEWEKQERQKHCQ